MSNPISGKNVSKCRLLKFVPSMLNVKHFLFPKMSIDTWEAYCMFEPWRIFLIFPENRALHFVQMVSVGDILNEMSQYRLLNVYGAQMSKFFVYLFQLRVEKRAHWGHIGNHLTINHFNTCHVMGKFSRRQTDIFLIFPRKNDLTFHVNCLHFRQIA